MRSAAQTELCGISQLATVCLLLPRYVKTKFQLIRNRHRTDTKTTSTNATEKPRVSRGGGHHFTAALQAGFCLIINQSSTILATCL